MSTGSVAWRSKIGVGCGLSTKRYAPYAPNAKPTTATITATTPVCWRSRAAVPNSLLEMTIAAAADPRQFGHTAVLVDHRRVVEPETLVALARLGVGRAVPGVGEGQ